MVRFEKKNTNLFWFVLFVSIRPLTLKAIKADYNRTSNHYQPITVCPSVPARKKRPPTQIAGQREMWLFCWRKVYKNKNCRLLLFFRTVSFQFFYCGVSVDLCVTLNFLFSSGWYPVYFFFVELRGNDLLSVSKCFIRRNGRPTLTESFCRGKERKEKLQHICVYVLCVCVLK